MSFSIRDFCIQQRIRVCSKTKLYRYDADSSEWKERGIGQAKLLQHKENKKIRMLMRQEKTLKIRANHLGEVSLGLGD